MTLTDPDVSRRPVKVRPILLPAAGDGQRRRRRHARQRVLRQRWVAGGSVVVAAVAAVLLLRGTHSGTQKVPTVVTTVPAGVAANPSVTPGAAVAPPSVLIQRVNRNRTLSIAAFLPSADGAGGTVLVFPAKTALSAVAANLPRHRAETILTLDDNQLVSLLQRAGTLQVAVPGAGPVSVAPADVPRFLAGGSGDPLAAQRAFWDAWLAQVKGAPDAMPAQAALAQAVQVLVKGAWTVAVPPGTAGG